MSNYYQPDPNAADYADQTDEWHSHGGDEPAPQSEHGQMSPRWISVGLLASFIFVGLIGAGLAWAFVVVTDQEKARKHEIDTGLGYVSYATQALAQLSTIAPADEAGKLVRAPIDLAMKDVAAMYAQPRPAPAGGKK